MLTRWNGSAGGYGLAEPFAWMEDLRREVDRAFDDLERSLGLPRLGTFARDGHLALDVIDEGERYLVRAELPGVREEDVDVSYEAGSLTIHARREVTTPEGRSARRRERASFDLVRTVTLPVAVDPDRAEARLLHGILEVAIPKAPHAAPRRLPVKGSSPS